MYKLLGDWRGRRGCGGRHEGVQSTVGRGLGWGGLGLGTGAVWSKPEAAVCVALCSSEPRVPLSFLAHAAGRWKAKAGPIRLPQ